MQCRNDIDYEDNNTTTTEDEINATIDRLLASDRRERCAKRRRENNSDVCNDIGQINHREQIIAESPEERDCIRKNRPICPREIRRKRLYIGVERSRRFSLRVMEALRAIQRRREDAKCPSTSSTTSEIVDFVETNFCCDGDVEAQIRTALGRLTCQGFVKEKSCDTYDLVGPLATPLCRAHKANISQSQGNVTTTRKIAVPRTRPNAKCKKNKTNRVVNSPNDNENDDLDIDLSIPSSIADNINRRRSLRTSPKQRRRSVPSPRRANNPVARQCIFEAGDDGCARRRNSELSEPVDDHDRSSVGEEALNDIVDNDNSVNENDPLGQLGLGQPEFQDDGQDEEYEIPEENYVGEEQLQGREGGNENNDDDQAEDEVDNDNDDDDGVASDDSAMREIRIRDRQEVDEARQKELRQWIKGCRRECLRRAELRGDEN